MGMDDWAAQAADAAAQRPRVVELTKDKDFLQSYAVHMGAAAASAIRDANKPGPAPATAAATASGPSPRQPPAGPDPYVWLNPVFMESFATTIAGELARLDPAHAPEFLRRARSFMDEADRIDKDYIERLAPLRGSHLVTWRPALGHIARRYGLVEIALSDGEGTYPSAARREEVRKLIANLKIKTVFADSQPAPGPLEELARQTGARVSRLDLIGGPASSGYESYSAMMRSNLAALVAGLKEGN
jgi:ABC-type Zn uptake system ZnuABC Zn-binding protein ZnuA